MAPNLKPIHFARETELIIPDAPKDDTAANLTELLDNQADTDGLKSMNADAADWTDVKHSERKKRDRILDGKLILFVCCWLMSTRTCTRIVCCGH